jgi:hypothetical protein
MISTVRTRFACVALLAGITLLAGCGPQKKSVFPPTVSLQEVSARSTGPWHLTVRIRNNSYGGMSFQTLQGSLRVGNLGAVLLDAKIDQDIPSFAADVTKIDILPTPEMSKALAELAAKGSAGALPYSIDGSITGLPEQEKEARSFEVRGTNWLSPVPGIPDTYRSP